MTDDSVYRGVSRTIAILRVIAASQEGGLRTSEISDELGLSYSATRRLLHALLAEQAVELAPDGRRYRMGREITLLGLARTHHSDLRRCAEGHMRQLVGDFRESVYLTVRSHADSVCIHREIGTSGRKVLSISEGSRRPLGTVIGSIAYLAALDASECESIIDENRSRYPHWGVTSSLVIERVEFARHHGYAYASQGLRPGTRSVAAAIQDGQGKPCGSLSIAAVADIMDPPMIESMAQSLRHKAELIAAVLNSQASRTREPPVNR
ncbi:IclR family transcriptional regulator [Bordetella sp. BOR01]|uniref:IclR family transcriptional regulator n=1 Tax=Bordetella sp. BOR01 TaxID=2854779 RepID=UPI001C46DEC4|nr:IclR family transcriptional regulator [Bordetella sp. BOR01]MBV7484856.1 IclR family transcriptional regulator [Bordetella sp. BOR01]